MDLIVKNFNKEIDFQILESFCKKRNLPCVPVDILSDFGLVVFNGEIPVVAGFLYPTMTSKLCIIENVITNIDEKNKSQAMSLLFTTLHEIAKDMGFKYVKNSVESSTMKQRLINYGYVEVESNVSTFIGVL